MCAPLAAPQSNVTLRAGMAIICKADCRSDVRVAAMSVLQKEVLLMKPAAFVLPLALALTSAPLLAKESPNSAAITAHLDTLIGEDYQACLNRERYSPQELIVLCKAAIDGIEAKRKAAPRASIGEKANFDFVEATLQGALGLEYITVDTKPSARFCGSLERVWLLRQGLLTIPAEELPAEAYEAFQDIPKQLAPLVKNCRTDFGTPKGAPPIP